MVTTRLNLTLLCCITLTGLCASCALRPDSMAVPTMPGAFARTEPGQAAGWPSQDWYRNFGSSELNGLIDAASNANFDLKIAQARIAEADARARQAHAGILPSLGAKAAANRYYAHSSQGSLQETDWSALLSASYELDFWGKNRATADSAQFQAVASRADRDTVALTLLAGIADGYFQVLSLRERIALAKDNVKSARDLLSVTSSRFDAGMANPVELATQRSTLAAVESTVPELQQTESEAEAALAVLLGRQPEGFDVAGIALDAIEEPKVTAGLPTQLLTRRPDLFAAEANLKAAHADVVVARAALLPSITLTADGGIANPAVAAAVNTLTGVGPALNLGGSLLQSIFDGGKLRAMRAEAQAKDSELLFTYQAAILTALTDVENALSAIHHLQAMRPFQLEGLAQSERAYEGAKLRYQQGYGDYLSVLEAQKLLFTARDSYSQYRLARLHALVSLSKALGGGWQAPGSQAASSGSPQTPPTI